MLGRCSHEFSWPRRGGDGDYYKVCLLCAAEYKYDWTTMRRTQRVEHAKPESSCSAEPYAREALPSWVPRARRLKLDIPPRYRVRTRRAHGTKESSRTSAKAECYSTVRSSFR